MSGNLALEAFLAYGRNYVRFFIVDVERLEEWRGISFPEFEQALVNANAPAFDPAVDLRTKDENGRLYDAAVAAAWAELEAAFAAEEVE